MDTSQVKGIYISSINRYKLHSGVCTVMDIFKEFVSIHFRS